MLGFRRLAPVLLMVGTVGAPLALGFDAGESLWYWPNVGDEFLIDTTIAWVPERSAFTPTLAFDGTNWLVVWQGVVGTRVTQDGVVLDTAGIPVSAGGYSPSVAFDGVNYLVVWHQDVGGSYNIYGARVTQQGVLLDTTTITISAGPTDETYASVGFDTLNYLVVWEDERNGDPDIYGARVSQDGSVLDPDGIPIRTAAAYQGEPSISYDGTNYLVVWSNCWDNITWYDIHGARVTPDGTVLDPGGLVISGAGRNQWRHSVAFGRWDHLVVWNDERSVAIDGIYGAMVTPGGVVRDPGGIAILAEPDGWEHDHPSVAFDGTNYWVVWQDTRNGYPWRDIYGARVSPWRRILDPGGVPICTTSSYRDDHPAIASGETSCLTVFQRLHGSTSTRGVRITPDGVPLDPGGFLISFSASDQEQPSVASDGTDYFVVWGDYCKGSYFDPDIYGARVRSDGTVLDPRPVGICTREGSQKDPAVASGSANYLVVWEDGGFYGARVSHSGVLLDTLGIPICTCGNSHGNPAVSSDGTDYLAVWQEFRNGIYAGRVTQQGAVLDTGGVMVTATGYGPSVAFGDTNYLVVWVTNGSIGVSGARINQQAVVLDSSGIIISPVGDWPSVAFDGENYLVAWAQGWFPEADIFAARVTQDGTVLGRMPICTAPGHQGYPWVAFDGSVYLITWHDARTGDYNICGCRVAPDGTVWDRDGFPISTSWGRQMFSSVCAGSLNHSLVAYQGETGPPYNSNRIYGVLITETGVEEHQDPAGGRPEARLLQSYPNPFAQATDIRYQVPSHGHISLRIYDQAGRLVRTLVDGDIQAGCHFARWDGRRSDGAQVPSGIYFYRLTAGEYTATKKLVMVR